MQPTQSTWRVGLDKGFYAAESDQESAFYNPEFSAGMATLEPITLQPACTIPATFTYPNDMHSSNFRKNVGYGN